MNFNWSSSLTKAAQKCLRIPSHSELRVQEEADATGSSSHSAPSRYLSNILRLKAWNTQTGWGGKTCSHTLISIRGKVRATPFCPFQATVRSWTRSKPAPWLFPRGWRSWSSWGGAPSGWPLPTTTTTTITNPLPAAASLSLSARPTSPAPHTRRLLQVRCRSSGMRWDRRNSALVIKIYQLSLALLPLTYN